MGAIHIGIRHDDDFVVAQLGYVKVFMDSGSKCRNHGLNLRIAVNPVHSGFFHVQYLASEGQDGLSGPGTGRLG